MKRYNTILANILLLVYLPMALLISFHTHSHNDGFLSENEVHHSQHLEQEECPICLFMHLVYEDDKQEQFSVILPEVCFYSEQYSSDVVSSLKLSELSRAPPFML